MKGYQGKECRDYLKTGEPIMSGGTLWVIRYSKGSGKVSFNNQEKRVYKRPLTSLLNYLSNLDSVKQLYFRSEYQPMYTPKEITVPVQFLQKVRFSVKT